MADDFSDTPSQPSPSQGAGMPPDPVENPPLWKSTTHPLVIFRNISVSLLHILHIEIIAGVADRCFIGPRGKGSRHEQDRHLAVLLDSVWYNASAICVRPTISGGSRKTVRASSSLHAVSRHKIHPRS